MGFSGLIFRLVIAFLFIKIVFTCENYNIELVAIGILVWNYYNYYNYYSYLSKLL